MKKFFGVSFLLLLIGALFLGMNYYLHQDLFYFLKPSIKIEKLTVYNDLDQDGLTDLDDILEGARKEVKNKTTYRSAYYKGGYPPENEGVCTDVIWRALINAGYDLKTNMDRDIKNHLEDYPRVKEPDPNIDFRRVKNQFVFFKKYTTNLTTKVIPYDEDNLTQWQGGDIVILRSTDHIAIVSDKRRKDGVPYIIHNAYARPKEEDRLLSWYENGNIIGHFRWISKDE